MHLDVRPLRNILRNDCSLTRCDVGPAISIDTLPDDVLLAIFDFCVDDVLMMEAWQLLVHVCRRWRSVVFGSPRRLDLRLVCKAKTPARDHLDIWPAFPLFIECYGTYPTEHVDNIIAVLERSDRVCQINLGVLGSHLDKISAAMQEPFPELTHLELWSYNETEAVLPDSFLGGSAPRLQFLLLERISYPGLPKLLLSATHLVDLRLFDIPHSGYISPEALSTLTSLEQLWLRFQSPRSRPDQASRRPPPLTRTVLPTLIHFEFKGVTEYLEDVVSRIDAPRLNNLYITFFNDIEFDTPQFIQFISRTPTLKALETARVAFGDEASEVNLSSQTPGYGKVDVKISCSDLDWQVSSLGQLCGSPLPPFSTLEDLYIDGDPYWQPHWEEKIDNMLWLELLLPFTTVKNFYLSREFASRIELALQELVGGSTTEVLPALQNIFLEGLEPSGPIQEGIEQFVAERRVTGHPITVTPWERDWE